MVSFFLILESFNTFWGHLSEFENSVRYGVVNFYYTVAHWIFKFAQMTSNRFKTLQDEKKWHQWVFKSLYSVNYTYIERI